MSAYKKTLITLALLFIAIVPVLGQGTLDATISADNNGVICAGNSINLKVNITGGTAPYTYSWSNGEITSTISVNKPIVYTVIIGDSTPGQTITRQITVTSVAAPDPPTAPGVIVCKGNPAKLVATAPVGATFQWYDSNKNFLVTGDSYTSPPVNAATFYYVEATVGGCTSPRTIVTVDLSADPTTTGANICAGNTATVSATGGDSYTWYDGPNGKQVGVGASFTTPSTLVSSATYYVVAITNGCPSAPIPATVNVTPYPQTPVLANTTLTVCSGSSVNLHADVSDGGIIAWYDSPTSTTPLISSPDYSTPGLSGPVTYYVENSLGQCTSPRVSVTITVTPIPDAPTVGPATACNGTSTTLTATSASGGSFLWYADAAGTTPLPNNNTNPFTTPILTATTTYYVQTVSNSGCSSSLTPVTITVTDNPPAPTVGPVAQPCPGTPATLQAIGPGGGVYSWYDAATGGNLLATGDTFTPIVLTNTIYYVQITDATTTCTSARTAVPVTVLPTVPPPAAKPVTTCYNTTATLTATGYDNYQWFANAAGGNQLTAGETFITDKLIATTTFYVQTTANGCASARTPVTVTVTPVPQQPTLSGASLICPGTPTTLTASVTDGGTINWYDAATDGTLLATGNNYTPTVNNTTTYYAENTLGTCTGPRAAITVATIPVPYPQFVYPSATVCKSATTFTPVIKDPDGGTFTATPAGLVFTDKTKGIIDVTASAKGQYIIKFVGNEACQSVTQATIQIVDVPDATFSYGSPSYCQLGATNPSPVFTPASSAGKFTANSTNLVFIDANTGVIDLQNSKPGTYTVVNTIAKSGTCDETSEQTNVTIIEGVIINAGPDQAVGSGLPAKLKGTAKGAQGVKWTTDGKGKFDDDTILNPVYTPVLGETTATLTLTSTSVGTCGTQSGQVKITIAPQPSDPVVPPQATCAGSSVTLTAKSPSGGVYDWFNVPSGGTSLFRGDTYTTDPVTTTTNVYYVQTNVLGNISNRVKVTITVNDVPTAPIALPQVTCVNTSARLTATGSPGGYEWYATPFGGTPLSLTDTYNTTALAGNTAYYVQAVSNSGCISPRTKVDVTITQPPIFTSAATDQVCSGSLLTYNTKTNVPATYSWVRPPVTGIINSQGTGISGIISETLLNTTQNPVKVTYNITATGKEGCSSVFQYIVTVNPFGTIKSALTGKACNGEPVNYTPAFSDGGVTFTWSRAAVAGISNKEVLDQAATSIKESLYNTTNAPVDVTYTFNYIEGSCPGTFTYVVTVQPPVTVSSINYSDACSGIPINYAIVSNVPSATFIWRRETFPNISDAPVHNQTSQTITEALTNTGNSVAYVPYFIIPYNNGCPGQEFVFVAGVYPVPANPTATSNTPVCAGNTIFLQTAKVAGATYQWTGPNGNVIPNPQNLPNLQILNATATDAGTYHLTIIVNNCPSPTASTTVVINALPIVTVAPDQRVCITQNIINLTGDVKGGTTTGIWTSSGTGSFSSPAGQLNAQYVPSALDKSNGSVALTLTSTSKDDCKPATAITTITFGPTPAVNAGADLEACAQSHAIPLNGLLLKPGSATWSSAGTGTFVPNANSLTASYIPSPADSLKGTVTLTLTYNNATVCDIASDDMVIKLIPPPTVYAGGSRYVLKDHTITLQPTVSDENVQYLWTPSIGLNDNTAKNPVVTGGGTDRLYTLTITDSRGCTSQDQALIKVSPVLNVNNTFTPNGDGVNDTWTIEGLLAYVDANIEVYNRYGKLLYHSIGYDKPWDGTYNGQQLPVGTYYYVIRLNVNNQILSGSITILR